MTEATKPSLGLMPLAPFDPLSDPTSLGQRWKTWKRRFEVYVTALDIQNAKQKRALLLYQVGEATQTIFDTLADTGEDYETAMTKLNEYFTPKKNVDYEIFKFRTTTQNAGETIDQYTTRLRKLAANCEFPDMERELKSTIIQNCLSKRLRRIALRDDLSLDNLLAKARSIEASETQASGMEQFANETTNRLVSRKQYYQPPAPPNPKPPAPPNPPTTKCRNCGLAWPHTDRPCPAKGQTCNKCGKLNHFAHVCMSRTVPPATNSGANQSKSQFRVRQVETIESSDSSDEYLYTLGNPAGSKTPVTSVLINSVPIKMMIDTGASTDIIDEHSFEEIKRHSDVPLQPPTKRIFAYGSESQLAVCGQFTANLAVDSKNVCSTLHVIQGNYGSLLSYKTASSLGLVDVKVNQVRGQPQTSDVLIQQFPTLFDGIGKLKYREVSLHIDDSVTPVAQPPRRIPFHMRKEVEEELDNLERQGIIEKVEGPTPWVSPLSPIPKKTGGVRLCVDMRMANKAIRRERHPTPTIDDLMHTLNGSSVYSKLDLRAGYHQIPLAADSQNITTFATHKGLRRYACLNFGTNSASEMFQHIISELLRDIPGAMNISDDIIVFGKTQADHDEALRATFLTTTSHSTRVSVNSTGPQYHFSDSSFQRMVSHRTPKRFRPFTT